MFAGEEKLQQTARVATVRLVQAQDAMIQAPQAMEFQAAKIDPPGSFGTSSESGNPPPTSRERNRLWSEN
ncbi:hypothetical protein NEUTE2DRAFT_70963 [Neurospora tetrasperma FGSC 2509]|nr:hypothetical protein NEUTE2DRAFT_70963 [Neurospora tetrasperma FGSC 2509]